MGATILHIYMLIWADQLTLMMNMRSQTSKTVAVKGVNQSPFFLQTETWTASMGQPIHHHGLCDWVRTLQNTLTSQQHYSAVQLISAIQNSQKLGNMTIIKSPVRPYPLQVLCRSHFHSPYVRITLTSFCHIGHDP